MANKEKSVKISSIRQKTHKGIDNIMDKAQSMKDSSNKAMIRSKEKIIMMRKNVDSYIGENPEKSVLIATCVGLVVGAIFTVIIMKKKKNLR